MNIYIYIYIYIFIPLACAECDDSLLFSGVSSIPLCCMLFPSTLLQQLFFHPPSLHLSIYFLVYLSAFLLPKSVGRGRAGYRPDHDQQHCYHPAPTVKPEAATAVVELLMMGVKTPETCRAVHKRQVIKLRNCCTLLVGLFEMYDDAGNGKL